MAAWIRMIWLAGLFFCGASLAIAQSLPPEFALPITSLDVNVHCSTPPVGREAAPGTELGYTQTVGPLPILQFHQQTVPAALGVAFGVSFTSEQALQQVRNLTFRPGKAEPDVWFEDYAAQAGQYRGFSFDFPNELTPGVWRFEAWNDNVRLYRVEFDVVPATALPDIVAQCQAIS